MRTLRRLATLAVLAATMSACNAGDSLGPDGSISGTFRLRTVAGQQLPYTFPSGTTLVSESITFSRNGTYTTATVYGNGQQFTEQGYYDSDSQGDESALIYFDPTTGGEPFEASLTENTLTSLLGGYWHVYQRQ